MTMRLPLLAAAATLALQASAHAVPVTTTADLSLRIGPGSSYPRVAVIDRGALVDVANCVNGGTWCQVSWNGLTGWSYSAYLRGAQVVVRTEVVQPAPTVVYETQLASAAPAGSLGTLTIPLASTPATVATVIEPPPQVQTYVRTRKVEPIIIEGEPVVGATLPRDIVAHPVPQYQYGYTVVNGRVVLVEQGTNKIVYVYR
jgi:hypothetical protein